MNAKKKKKKGVQLSPAVAQLVVDNARFKKQLKRLREKLQTQVDAGSVGLEKAKRYAEMLVSERRSASQTDERRLRKIGDLELALNDARDKLAKSPKGKGFVRLMRHRERLVRAFCAQMGCWPNDCYISEEATAEGGLRVYIFGGRPALGKHGVGTEFAVLGPPPSWERQQGTDQ